MSETKVKGFKATASFGDSKQEAILDISPYVVKDAYFASKKEEIAYEQIKGVETDYPVASGDNLSKIASKNGITVAQLKSDNGLTSNNLKVGQELKIKKGDTKKEKGKKVSFIPITKASVGDEVYLVVKTQDLEGETIKLKIHQGKQKVLADIDKAITLLYNGKDEYEFKAIVGELAKDTTIENKKELENLAVAKVTLSPKEDKDVKKWDDEIKKTTDKKTYLYLYVEADSAEKVLYEGKNKDGTDNDEKRFRNIEGEWLELDVCECCARMRNMTVDKDGFISGMDYTKNHQTKLENGTLSTVKAIVLHRTGGDNVLTAMSNTTLGTHFYVGKDGTVYQAASLNKKTQHVGSGLYSKEKDETGKGSYENVWPHKKRGIAELKKSYPDRYPINSESVGIEVAGKFTKTSGKETSGKYKGEDKGKWDTLTEDQKSAIVCLCKVLKKQYTLGNDDIFAHDDIKPKTKGEGSSYIDDILKELK